MYVRTNVIGGKTSPVPLIILKINKNKKLGGKRALSIFDLKCTLSKTLQILYEDLYRFTKSCAVFFFFFCLSLLRFRDIAYAKNHLFFLAGSLEVGLFLEQQTEDCLFCTKSKSNPTVFALFLLNQRKIAYTAEIWERIV